MANLKEIRIRITSVSSTMQITSAMKMVSAAKLKKAQDAIIAMRPYSNKLSELMQGLSGATSSEEKSFTFNHGYIGQNLLILFLLELGGVIFWRLFFAE